MSELTNNPPLERNLSKGRSGALLVLFCLALWLPGFFILPPTDRDESRFAQATKQMVNTGDYIRILNGTQARNRKPVGIYWLQAVPVLAMGHGLANPIWPYRIPSLLGGVLAVLSTFEIALLLGANTRSACMAGAMLAACVILNTEARIAKTDAALLGATTLSMLVLARAWSKASISRLQAALFWLAAAAGILIKGPVTPMVLGLTVLTLGFWQRQWRWLAPLRPGWGVPLLLALVLPWFITIEIVTAGRFLTDAVRVELGTKLTGFAQAHGGFPGLHLLLLPLLSFPASFAVLTALPAAWTARRETPIQFLIAWATPSWLVFEIMPTKLPHYTLPLYPALCIAAAIFMARAHKSPRWAQLAGRAGLVVAASAIGLVALALPLALHSAWWLGLPAAAAAWLSAILAWRQRLGLAMAACVPLYLGLFQLELPCLTALWIAPRVATMLRQDWPQWNAQGTGLATLGYAEPSLMFLNGTNIKYWGHGSVAVASLQQGYSSLVLVTGHDMADFNQAAKTSGFQAKQLCEITGFNYSSGRWVDLHCMAK